MRLSARFDRSARESSCTSTINRREETFDSRPNDLTRTVRHSRAYRAVRRAVEVTTETVSLCFFIDHASHYDRLGFRLFSRLLCARALWRRRETRVYLPTTWARAAIKRELTICRKKNKIIKTRRRNNNRDLYV